MSGEGTSATAKVARASNPARGSKPGERRGGRKPGTPNKLTADVKDMILGALNAAGGVEYLTRQADENPGPFMTLVGKVLPLQLAGTDSNGEQAPFRIELIGVMPK